MFEHYTPVERTEQLPVGNYRARIVRVEKKTVKASGSEYLSLTYEIDGHIGAKPDRASIFDEPKDPKYLEGYNRDLTLFFDSFGIPRGEKDFSKWVGHEGEITVCPQTDGSPFNEISYFPLTEQRLKNRIRRSDKKRSAQEKLSQLPMPELPERGTFTYPSDDVPF